MNAAPKNRFTCSNCKATNIGPQTSCLICSAQAPVISSPRKTAGSFCVRCGTRLPAQARFCTRCGRAKV